MPLPESSIERLVNGVYNGTISVFELPTFVYDFVVSELDGSFFMGFGDLPRGDIPAIEKAVNFRANIGRFSGAKTFSEVNELTKQVFLPDGQKRPFRQFRDIAREIDNTYNANWLAAEQDSVFTQSQNARAWLRIEEEAEIFPLLRYLTVGDDRVRPSHMALDNITRPVNDPIWNRIAPQNGWRCRCRLIQLSEAPLTSNAALNRMTRQIDGDFSKRPEFDFNPGKKEFIFKEKGRGKHEYFKVPRQFRPELRRNFGFPSVEEVTGTRI